MFSIFRSIKSLPWSTIAPGASLTGTDQYNRVVSSLQHRKYVLCLFSSLDFSVKQAGAELCQAQIKLWLARKLLIKQLTKPSVLVSMLEHCKLEPESAQLMLTPHMG